MTVRDEEVGASTKSAEQCDAAPRLCHFRVTMSDIWSSKSGLC